VSARLEARAWLAQRVSAAVLALCVAVHLATMILAVRGGLTAGAILGRTHGNAAWAVFYGVFVVAVAVHAPLGLRTVAAEWLAWRGRTADVTWIVVGVALLLLGLRAVVAVTQ
jgi:fumarate reductase subunit C